MTRAAATALGLKLFAPKGTEAAAATAILPPEGTDSGAIVKGLKSQFATIVTDGQGEMKGQLFRIAHIGFFDYMDTIAVIGALEQVAEAKTPTLPTSTFGTGLIAAQKFFADHSNSLTRSSKNSQRTHIISCIEIEETWSCSVPKA